jgi:hypothetical protein
LPDADAYRHWCEGHGFSPRLHKSWRERLKERSFAGRDVAAARIARTRLESRKGAPLLAAIFRGEMTAADFTQPQFVAICQALQCFDAVDPTREVFQSLLEQAGRHSNLLRAGHAIAALGRQPGNCFVSGLAAIAQQSAAWVRALKDWKPQSHNPRKQFASLLYHLFCRWPVPEFMNAAWFQWDVEKGVEQQRWYLHLARGESIRTAGLPIAYTKRMAHYFLRAPADLTIEEALRWGQVRALGGCEQLARATLGTHLAMTFDDDEFWTAAIRLFINHSNPALWRVHIGPVCDYLQQAKLAPGFSLQGRTLSSLLRQMGLWHRSLAGNSAEPMEWSPAPIRPFVHVEGSEAAGTRRIWTITELLSTDALLHDGRTQQHCVATYAQACAQGETSIWSLELEDAIGKRKVLTIEVNRTTRIIRQAKGKQNRLPTEQQLELLRRWSQEASLVLAKWVARR